MSLPARSILYLVVLGCLHLPLVGGTYVGGFSIEGGVPRYLGDFNSDVWGLYNFQARAYLKDVDMSFGVRFGSSLLDVSISDQLLLEAGLQIDNLVKDLRISATDFVFFYDQVVSGGNNRLNSISVLIECGYSNYESRSQSGDIIYDEGNSLLLGIGILFQHNLSRTVGIRAGFDFSIVEDRYDAWNKGIDFPGDTYFRINIGIDIHDVLPRPHRFE